MPASNNEQMAEIQNQIALINLKGQYIGAVSSLDDLSMIASFADHNDASLTYRRQLMTSLDYNAVVTSIQQAKNADEMQPAVNAITKNTEAFQELFNKPGYQSRREEAQSILDNVSGSLKEIQPLYQEQLTGNPIKVNNKFSGDNYGQVESNIKDNFELLELKGLVILDLSMLANLRSSPESNEVFKNQGLPPMEKLVDLTHQVQSMDKLESFYDKNCQKLVDSLSGISQRLDQVDNKSMSDFTKEEVKNISNITKELQTQIHNVPEKIKENQNASPDKEVTAPRLGR